ncbi:MAG: right-handed parallel beta-helix repeat-containing protein [Opitutae bacterium]|nr:right-handed parallel beta-helix repeat-containing protein [Opitutae bacterium]
MASSPSSAPSALFGREYHVATTGHDAHAGTAAQPLRTISAAAALAQPGDTITVHAGVYRERVTPPRGGTSDTRRIVYQAAPGETVTIKGSEEVCGWQPFQGEVWKLSLSNAFFGAYNPYQDRIAGDWFDDKGRPHHTGEVYLNGKSLYEAARLDDVLRPQPHPRSRDPEGSRWTWYCEVDGTHTHLFANFHGKDPNAECVEINVRDACFYPAAPGCDYITVRGFRMCHAATQWAAPTAEQIGLLGTHWSKGWVIEHNVISDSKCSGITLGKDRATGHNVWSADPAKDGSIHYIEVIERALAAGWSRETIGSHVVRANVISDCEQTGICGSLGAVFSEIADNHIHRIWTKRQFDGFEIAGIKLHAAIDVLIRGNRIHNACRGMWLDWMAQGTRISANLCYDNTTEDLFMEVNHGPFLVDNNLLLSGISLNDMSQGGTYAHNLLVGRIDSQPEPNRSTPFHAAHATNLAGCSAIHGGDDRFYNNLFLTGTDPGQPLAERYPNAQRELGFGLQVFDRRPLPLHTAGNGYGPGVTPHGRETQPFTLAADPALRLVEEGAAVYVQLTLGPELRQAATVRVTTALLGCARISGLPYESPDGTPLTVDTDYRGEPRDAIRPTAGPFELPGEGPRKLKVW